jgi:protein-S-isoprenylcysteine O-methyltransferase Ste14
VIEHARARSSMTWPKAYADTVARLRVPGGFVLVAAFAWFSRPTLLSLGWSVPVSLGGLLLRGWSAGCLAKDQALATAGPYAYTRNPLYLGTLLVAAGLVIGSRSTGLAALFAVVFALVYLPVIQLEEQHLKDLFPEYRDYAATVPALLPRFRGGGVGASRRLFRWRLYLKNREYQAGAGYAAGMLLLLWKALR